MFLFYIFFLFSSSFLLFWGQGEEGCPFLVFLLRFRIFYFQERVFAGLFELPLVCANHVTTVLFVNLFVCLKNCSTM